jgi:cytochrome c
VHLVQNMDDQPRYKAQSESRFFADGLSMREPIEGTVPRGWLRLDSSVYYEGKDAGGNLVEKSPLIATMELLERGRQRYDIYCAPCHGRVGDAKSTVVKQGMLAPPSFHEQRLRDTADGHFYEVITDGVRNMPPYRYQIPVKDRWAIVAYVRALQRSQNATENDVPSEVRETMQ